MNVFDFSVNDPWLFDQKKRRKNNAPGRPQEVGGRGLKNMTKNMDDPVAFSKLLGFAGGAFGWGALSWSCHGGGRSQGILRPIRARAWNTTAASSRFRGITRT